MQLHEMVNLRITEYICGLLLITFLKKIETASITQQTCNQM